MLDHYCMAVFARNELLLAVRDFDISVFSLGDSQFSREQELLPLCDGRPLYFANTKEFLKADLSKAHLRALDTYNVSSSSGGGGGGGDNCGGGGSRRGSGGDHTYK